MLAAAEPVDVAPDALDTTHRARYLHPAMHHKGKQPKHQRAGCLYCKPHKDDRGENSRRALLPRDRHELAAAEEDARAGAHAGPGRTRFLEEK
jgi:hypothetical protein